MRFVLVVALSIGCGKGSAPEPVRAERPPDPPARDAAPPPDAGSEPDATPPDAAAPPDAPVAPRPLERDRGIGACKVDDDCVLSGDQQGCCTQACLSYAINRQVLAAREAKENCAAFRASGEPCPPPAPCPVPTHRTVAAKCIRGACYSLREKLAP